MDIPLTRLTENQRNIIYNHRSNNFSSIDRSNVIPRDYIPNNLRAPLTRLHESDNQSHDYRSNNLSASRQPSSLIRLHESDQSDIISHNYRSNNSRTSRLQWLYESDDQSNISPHNSRSTRSLELDDRFDTVPGVPHNHNSNDLQTSNLSDVILSSDNWTVDEFRTELLRLLKFRFNIADSDDLIIIRMDNLDLCVEYMMNWGKSATVEDLLKKPIILTTEE
jgi:hypothetical protein